LAARTTATPFSTARKIEAWRCWYGAEVFPNQASLVITTRNFASPSARSRARLGKTSSKQIKTPKGQASRAQRKTTGAVPALKSLIPNASATGVSHPKIIFSGMYSPNGTSRSLS